MRRRGKATQEEEWAAKAELLDSEEEENEEEEEEEEDEVVAYNSNDVDAVTERVLQWLRDFYDKEAASVADDASSSASSKWRVPHKDWPRDLHTLKQQIEKHCTVERQLKPQEVVALLSMMGLVSPLEDEEGDSSEDAAAKKERLSEMVNEALAHKGEDEEGDEEGEEGWWRGEKGKTIRLKLNAEPKALSQVEARAASLRLSDGTIILARVIARLRQLNAGSAEAGEEQALPANLTDLVRWVEAEKFGHLQHEVRASDVLEELELRDCVTINEDEDNDEKRRRKAEVVYNVRNIQGGGKSKGATSGSTKYLIGLCLFLFMFLPSLLSYLR
ncbi:hypothetical protein QOT17_014357 [Balamuthia mandrillaris]